MKNSNIKHAKLYNIDNVRFPSINQSSTTWLLELFFIDYLYRINDKLMNHSYLLSSDDVQIFKELECPFCWGVKFNDTESIFAYICFLITITPRRTFRAVLLNIIVVVHCSHCTMNNEYIRDDSTKKFGR